MEKNTLLIIVMVMVSMTKVQAASVVQRKEVGDTTEYSVEPTTLPTEFSTKNQESTELGTASKQASEYSTATTEKENQGGYSTEHYANESQTSDTRESLKYSEATTIRSVTSEESSEPLSKNSDLQDSQSTSEPALIPDDTKEVRVEVFQETKAEPIDLDKSNITNDENSKASSYFTNATNSDTTNDVKNATEKAASENVISTGYVDGAAEKDSFQENTGKALIGAGQNSEGTNELARNSRQQATSVYNQTDGSSTTTNNETLATKTPSESQDKLIFLIEDSTVLNEAANKDTKAIKSQTIIIIEATTEDPGQSDQMQESNYSGSTATETNEYLRTTTELSEDGFASTTEDGFVSTTEDGFASTTEDGFASTTEDSFPSTTEEGFASTTESSDSIITSTELSEDGFTSTTEPSEEYVTATESLEDSEQESDNSTLKIVEEDSDESDESSENDSKESEESAEENGSDSKGNFLRGLTTGLGDSDKIGRNSNADTDEESVNGNFTRNNTLDNLVKGSYNSSSGENTTDNATHSYYNARDAAADNVIDDDMSSDGDEEYDEIDGDVSSEEYEEDYDDINGDDDDAEKDDFGEINQPKRERGASPGFARHLRRFSQRNSGIMPWPNAMIPYVVWGSDKVKQRVSNALELIQNQTCLNFTDRTSEKRYVVIKEDDGGCWASSVGYPSSNKRVIVGLGKGCRSIRGITHEVLHAAGFVHEHNRPDRRKYINIDWDNIKKSGRSGFRLDNKYADLSIPYDYKSIMHYGRKAFAKDRSKPTLIPLNPVSGNLGGSTLSSMDVKRINAFYKC